ncbi:uracil-DNA glycosylase [Roseibacillus persicicus]|uniref:uracil-DNA glycosylase n=1 Tax=Roseibacillus persicicus TaxID=454148 RepID=UPI00280F0784|nr:uracil-DNA glycosylase [Roseibacillus persicicus]MDQ8190579.1 uracil-DNA glycosylase [Roseibacillus persicicus]
MLLPYLRQLLAKGETHLSVTTEAREVLRKMYKGEINLSGEARARKPAAAQAKTDSGGGPEPKQATQAEPMIARPTFGGAAKPKIEHVAKPVPQGQTPEEKLASLRDLAEHWPAFRDLGSFRKTLVFSAGPVTADLMLIGEVPGQHDEQKREPFAGPAGEKLEQILKAMGLSRDRVYLTNICKFRPALPGQTSNNRPPRPEEIAHSLPFVLSEIEIVQPKVIIALGAAASHALLHNSDSFDDLRSKWHQVNGVATRVSHHPSFLLLADKDALAEKRKIWEDMLVVMEKLGLPISDKQKGFFLPKK